MTDEQFILAVYDVVRAIPGQKIITHGQIAVLIGMPNSSRQVKNAVRFISHTTPPVPWYRAVSTSGVISMDDAGRHRKALEEDGIFVYEGTFGEWRVDFERSGWVPDIETTIRSTGLISELISDFGS
ncbi:hypothetical protein BJ138DRAFT_1115970 [Hygrophoropsis aurantiaca]|uniref:Uncharacterized protein n=1 Tax=Hygrophoropsis aurantiaca TaxID=72124 RepID=A0ACB8A5J7_9AGAM|nr:hypothetical protein BJ138DRAFT_1115970 [Hygrophoropsis aurantiaca]